MFGDELLVEGLPGAGRVRDSLGPQVPGWLRRYGAATVPGFAPRGPVEDTLEAHVAAIQAALAVSDLVCTTGGTMHGPVDHLHPALAELGARYIADTVAVRPGFPMLLAEVPGAGPGGRTAFVAGLPGNPQSAIVALVSLVVPLLAGLTGRAAPAMSEVTLGETDPRAGGPDPPGAGADRGLRPRPPVGPLRLGHAAWSGPGRRLRRDRPRAHRRGRLRCAVRTAAPADRRTTMIAAHRASPTPRWM